MFLLLALLINAPVADLMHDPTYESMRETQAIYGAQAKALEEKGEWAKVRLDDGYEAWIETTKLIDAEPGPVATASLQTHLYRVADTSPLPEAMTLPMGSKLKLVESDGERWLLAELLDGRQLWVQRGDLDFEQNRLNVNEMLKLAERFIGSPYTWGGTSSFGYDCSAFTQMLYSKMGVEIGRNTGDQIRSPNLTAVTELQAGDLLFFQEADANHVAIYIGDEKIINASVVGTPTIHMRDLGPDEYANLEVRRAICL